MTQEEKIFEKIRAVLIADSVLNGYTNKRVYCSHISTITNAEYPAISLHLINSVLRTNVPTMADIIIQHDIWIPSKNYTSKDIFICAGRVRALLHGQFLTDSILDLKVFKFFESNDSKNLQIMFEPDTQLYHLPMIYEGAII